MRIKEIVKEILKEKGMSQKDLADKMEITQSTLSTILNGSPHLSTLQRMADALEIHIWELFDPDSDQTTRYLTQTEDALKLSNDFFYQLLDRLGKMEKITIRCPHCGKEMKLSIGVNDSSIHHLKQGN